MLVVGGGGFVGGCGVLSQNCRGFPPVPDPSVRPSILQTNDRVPVGVVFIAALPPKTK